MRLFIKIVSFALLLALASCRAEAPSDGFVRIADSLNNLSFELRYKDMELSKGKAFEALNIIEKHTPEYFQGKAEAWNHIAYSNFLTSHFDSTRFYLQKVRDIPTAYDNREIEEAITYITEARIFLRECRYADAFVIYDSTLTIFNGPLHKLKYNDLLPLKRYDHRRYHFARSDFLIGNATLDYYYRDSDMPTVLALLDQIERDPRLHIDTTQLSILYYSYAGTYERAAGSDPASFHHALDYVIKGLDLLSDPSARNDYYVANLYQVASSLARRAGSLEASHGDGSDSVGRRLADFRENYLVNRYGWEPGETDARTFDMVLLQKADSLFRLYDDPYQNLASDVHIAHNYLSRGDTLGALSYLTDAIAADSVMTSRGGYGRIWRRHLYNTLLSTMAERFPIGEVQRWYGIYAREATIIAENTRRDYNAQKGKTEAEALARRSIMLLILILTVCLTVSILLYFLVRQNRKLKIAAHDNAVQYEQLRFMQKKLIEQKRMELLTYVVRGISHELSQPLGSITQTLYDTVADVERLGAGRDSLSEEEYLRAVENIATDLATISRSKDAIGDLVNSFRNTIRENIVDPEAEFNLRDRLEDILKVVRPTVKSNISISVECDPAIVVRSFPLLLSQVVTNLVANANQHAFHASDDPGDAIRIVCRRSGDDLVMQCIDNGVGVPDEELDRLCQPFVSGKRTNLGLGLSLVKNIVEQYMKGEVAFTSGEGLTVTVTIPGCIIN